MAKILVVDDAAFMRNMLKGILSELGYEIAGEAADGAEAVRLYKQIKPDLVIMDITMPEKDGLAALKEIRMHDPAAKVIVCSAMGQKGIVVDAIQAGAKDFIVKPFNRDRIQEAIIRQLAVN